jgi:membrane-bound ClpP family serine protease
MAKHHRVPWFLWPFWLVWRLVTLIFELTGRLVAAVLGLVLVIVGVVLTATVVGAVVGVPLIVFGFLLIVRGFY